ncbi:MAG: hypothetical protein UY89_C0002G0007 [Parcubacteria group bacterium GW2011_GWA1_54_9]|nr:MAG: hypothetical protein UY89_C0002G0007 [Parcubacteria group bacterium GW2011_GWA1_54_9]
MIIITIISILGIAGVTWLINRILPFTVCPICAGGFLTWVWLLAAYYAGYDIPLLIPAILMGGSVVGVTYQIEKTFSRASEGMRMLWKVLFIPAGFIAAYAVLEQLWTVLLAAIVFLLAMSLAPLFLGSTPGLREGMAGDIEKKMRDCC